MHPQHHSHQDYMQIALSMGYRNLGLTAENPSVGCVIVKQGRIISVGQTSPSGRPHAEVNALQSAIENTHGATLYVTLEPCCHIGKSPPCTDAILRHKIKHVVIGAKDPNPKVAGKGMEILRQNGVDVTFPVLEKECHRLHRGFFLTQTDQRPEVILKLALTGDGKLIAADKNWFTNAISRNIVHALRASCDGILVGGSTVRDDSPQLTCRLQGKEDHSPARFIWSNSLHSLPDSHPSAPATLLGDGSPAALLRTLNDHSMTRLMVEGGWQTSKQFLEKKLIDKAYIFHAPNSVGHPDAPTIGEELADYLKDFTSQQTRKLADNQLAIYSH